MFASDAKHPSPGLQDKLERLYALNRGARLELSFRPAYLDLLKALGNPHLNLPPVIHVAGTNGKGSTIAMMRAMLEASGKRAHVYTSPHLVRFNERIVLAGQTVSDTALEGLIDEVLWLNSKRDVSFFEITTALAFHVFSKTPADILLLEVGMGGRLDCTNIIESAAVSVITRVSRDHAEFLGDTLEAIASEKAGIMKPGTPCITGQQESSAMQALERESARTAAPLVRAGAEWFMERCETRIRFGLAGDSGDDSTHDSTTESLDLPLPALVGEHQLYNAGLALAALKTLEARDRSGSFKFDAAHLAQGLVQAHWPARLHRLDAALPPEARGTIWEFWLDGGHNPDAGEALAGQARAWKGHDSSPLYLVVGMMKHKDIRGFVAPLLKEADGVWAIDIPGEPGAMRAEDINTAAGGGLKTAQGFREAIAEIVKSRKPGRILVAGSLYLAGQVLRETGNTP